MKRGLSASEFTHKLAEAGGGAKSRGGGGMEEGLKRIAEAAAQNAIDQFMGKNKTSSRRTNNILPLRKAQ